MAHHTHNLQKLKDLGWQWHEDGAIVQVTGTDQEGQPVTCGVFVPVDRIWNAFQKHLGSVGCPFPKGVGAPFSVGSLFSWVKGAAKDVGGAVGKAGKEVEHVANKYGGHAVGKLGKEAMESKTFRGAVDIAAIAVPALAPAAAGLETAHQIYDKVEVGRHAAHAIAQGFHTPENHAAVQEAAHHLEALHDIIDMAHQGHPHAQEIIGGLHIIEGEPIPPPSPLTPPLPPHHPHHRHHHHLHPGVPAPPVDVTAPPAPPEPSILDSMPPGQPSPPTGYDVAPPPPPMPGVPHHHRHRHHHGHPMPPAGVAVSPMYPDTANLPGALPQDYGVTSPPMPGPGYASPYGYGYGREHVEFHPMMHHAFTREHAAQLHRYLGQNYPHLRSVPVR